MPDAQQPLQERTRPQRVSLALSIANVWACGVASAQHEWTAVAIAMFFAGVCWGMSSARVIATFETDA